MDPPLSPPPPPLHSDLPTFSEMENPDPHFLPDDDPSSFPWDWSDFLDFGLDNQVDISFDSDQHQDDPEPPPIAPDPDANDTPDRIRKRDPRLTCSNFLAGRIPCACPEMDGKLEEEEGTPGKKRARTVRATAAGVARCQVPACEKDISELKGYHRRHRVCLQCANASAVILDGHRRRYCQQCGKFHILSDFDEGKRSCRRKLERHNNRRRRKPSESKIAVERESQGLVSADDVACPIDNGKDGTSVMQVKVEERAPKLHYVHPTCFEAGKPMEFVACGSNLLQSKFRFLVSFGGKYLPYDYSVAPPCGDTEGVTASFDHQLLKIYIPHTEPNLFGPAFIEVENESGLSNFIPILIGNEEICSEMKMMEHRFESSFLSNACEVSIMRQTAFSQFILDTAWLLRKPALQDIGQILTFSQIGRFNQLLTFLIDNKSTSILERVLQYTETMIDKMKLNNLADGISDTDMKLLKGNLDHAREILCQRLWENGDSLQDSGNLVQKGDCLYRSSQIEMLLVSRLDQNREATQRGNLEAIAGSNSPEQSANLPLLKREVVMSMNLSSERPRKFHRRIFINKYLASHPLIFVIAATAICFGICVVLLHPQKVGKFATTIRMCLFDNK
ncbi:Squamosa promoter-binding-like protein [Sarracenia purpurea var. burkii]